MDKVSYALGLGIGQQLAQMGATDLNVDDFAQSIKDVLAGNELKVSHREAQQIVQEYFAKKEEVLNAERAEKGKAAKAEGERYLQRTPRRTGLSPCPADCSTRCCAKATARSPRPRTA